MITIKVLAVFPPLLRGTGGEAIRTRNLSFLRQNFGEKDVRLFSLRHNAFFPDGRLIERLRDVKAGLRLTAALLFFRPQVIYLDNSRIRLPWRFLYKKYRIIAFFHNIEQDYERQIMSAYDYHDEKLLKQLTESESLICRYADLCICLNQRDSDRLLTLYGRPADHLMPTCFYDSYCADTAPAADDHPLLFVGSDFFGNTTGLFPFIEQVLDQLDQRLLVIGSGMDRYKNRYPQKNVEFIGFVPDLAPWYAAASCVVLPITSGSGMKTKTCEALMYGKTIFGTDEAFEGYTDIEQADCVRCNTPQEFISALRSFREQNRPDFSPAAREYFLHNYSSESVGRRFCTFLDEQNNMLLSPKHKAR